MNVIILSAGIGSRLMPLTKNTPKSLLKFSDGSTLLGRQLEFFQKIPNVTKIIVVTGYKSNKIEEYLENSNIKNVEISFNPFFRVSNNLMSVWIARTYMEDDFIITNGDNLYSKSILKKLNIIKDGITILLDKKKDYDEDDMKVLFKNGKIKKISKKIQDRDINNLAESVGFCIVKGEKYRKLFKNVVEKLAKDEKYLNSFWLEILNEIISLGYNINYIEIDKFEWQELDFHPDINLIEEIIRKTENIS